ncbi:MAG: Hsp20/alpha crystallin family protein [Dehalococcoidia bacterium]
MATSLTRWDPFGELAGMRTMLDRFFDEGLPRHLHRSSEELGAGTLGIDIVENGDELVVKAHVPGIDPKDVDISIEDDVLTIKGETRSEEEKKDDNYLRRELRYGSFQRSLRLPPTVDVEKASAKFENGELKLTLPKRPESKARSIKITPQGVIEGTSSAE